LWTEREREWGGGSRGNKQAHVAFFSSTKKKEIPMLQSFFIRDPKGALLYVSKLLYFTWH
jgi:hypothetical protein